MQHKHVHEKIFEDLTKNMTMIHVASLNGAAHPRMGNALGSASEYGTNNHNSR